MINNKGVLLYEGKAKQVFSTENKDEVIIHYKDDATAYNGIKKSTVMNKGILNNHITTLLYKHLEEAGIKTHLIEQLNDRDQRCKRVSIIPLEVIIRNVIAGSMAKRLGLEEGQVLSEPVYELCYKNDDFNDPLINEDHALALKLATKEELKQIKGIAMDINQVLKKAFDQVGICLVDFKIEFGKDAQGTLLLADEISPDTCRLWDKATLKKLDKDRFRRDLGHVEEAYIEILERLKGLK